MYKRSTLAALLAFTMLTACTGPEGLQDSGIEIPSFLSHLGASSDDKPKDTPLVTDVNVKVEHEWWKRFDDPTLDQLISETLRDNKMLALAKARVAEERASRNEGTLTVNQDVSYVDTLGEATWEVDFFTKNQARAAQASAIMQSEEAEHQAVLVGLLAEMARNYFDMRNYERQIAITQQNLDTEHKILKLTKAQFHGALAGKFDVQRATAQVSTTESQLSVLQTAYETTLNHINTLLGKPPGSRDTLLKTTIIPKPLDIQAAIAAPATVLATRPDVRAAERNFAAAISGNAVAVRELFPNVSLAAMFGIQENDTLGHATPWPASATAVLPILNFSAIQAGIDSGNAQQQQAFMHYQETVLEALENMEDALTTYMHETSHNALLTGAAEQKEKATELAHQQYTNGENSLLDVLVIERNTLNAQSAQAASDAQLRKDLVNIYTAAGGGWEAPQSY